MSPQIPLKICFIPYFGAPSHTISLTDIARYFSFHGQQITILATPSNGKLIQNLLRDDTNTSIALHIIPMPFKQVGLPEGFDELQQPEDIPTMIKVLRCVALLRQTVQDFLEGNDSDCVISDSMYPWMAEVAAHLKIPFISYNPYSILYLCIREALRSPDSPHHQIQSRQEPFVISGLPVPITMTKSELQPDELLPFQDPLREGELKSDIIMANSFLELEADNIEYFSKVTGVKVMAVGPASEIHRKISGRVERGYKIMDKENECLSWLNSKKTNSVLYVNFGSIVKFQDEQLMEIASALESSGHEFIWVALGKEDENDANRGKWLPIGFHERIKGKGLRVKGWAPQLSILNHPAVGGFMTHCGWNSLLEAINAGLPMITWPVTYEQFYNEKLVTQVLGIGLGVGGHEWLFTLDVGKKIITRENIQKAIQNLMDSDHRIDEMRKKAKKYGKMAKNAVEEDGSSYKNMHHVIQEVKKLKDIKRNAANIADASDSKMAKEGRASSTRNIADLMEEVKKMKSGLDEGGAAYQNLTGVIEEMMKLKHT